MSTNREKLIFVQQTMFNNEHIQVQMSQHPSIAILLRSIKPNKTLNNLNDQDLTKVIIDFINGIQKEVDDGNINPVDAQEVSDIITNFMNIENEQLGLTSPPEPRIPSAKLITPNIPVSNKTEKTSKTLSEEPVEEPVEENITITGTKADFTPNIPIMESEEPIQENKQNNKMFEGIFQEMVSGINQINEHLASQIEMSKEEEKENDRQDAIKPKEEKSNIFGGLTAGLVGMGGIIGGLTKFVPLFFGSLLSIVGVLGAVSIITGQIKFEDIIAGFEHLYQEVKPSLIKISDSLNKVLESLMPVFQKLFVALESSLIVTFDWLANTINNIIPYITNGIDSLANGTPGLMNTFKNAFGIVWEIAKNVGSVMMNIGNILLPVVTFLGTLIIPTLKVFEIITSALSGLIQMPINFTPFFLMPMMLTNIGQKLSTFNNLIGSVSGVIVKGIKSIGGIWTNLLTIIQGSDDLTGGAQRASKIFSTMGEYFSTLTNFGSTMIGWLSKIPMIGQYFVGIGEMAAGAINAVKGFGSMLKFIPNLFAKLAWPLTIFMGVIDFIKGFVSTEGTFLEKIKAGFGELLLGFVELPMTILNWGITKIGNILSGIGFGETAKMFANVIFAPIMGIVNFIKGFTSSEGGFWTKLTDGFTSAFMGFIELPLKVLKWVMEKAKSLLSKVPLIGGLFESEEQKNIEKSNEINAKINELELKMNKADSEKDHGKFWDATHTSKEEYASEIAKLKEEKFNLEKKKTVGEGLLDTKSIKSEEENIYQSNKENLTKLAIDYNIAKDNATIAHQNLIDFRKDKKINPEFTKWETFDFGFIDTPKPARYLDDNFNKQDEILSNENRKAESIKKKAFQNYKDEKIGFNDNDRNRKSKELIRSYKYSKYYYDQKGEDVDDGTVRSWNSKDRDNADKILEKEAIVDALQGITHTKEDGIDIPEALIETQDTKIETSKVIIEPKNINIPTNPNPNIPVVDIVNVQQEQPSVSTATDMVDIEGASTGGIISDTGLVNVHAGEVIGPLDQVRNMIQTENINEMGQLMSQQRKITLPPPQETSLMDKIINMFKSFDTSKMVEGFKSIIPFGDKIVSDAQNLFSIQSEKIQKENKQTSMINNVVDKFTFGNEISDVQNLLNIQSKGDKQTSIVDKFSFGDKIVSDAQNLLNIQSKGDKQTSIVDKFSFGNEIVSGKNLLDVDNSKMVNVFKKFTFGDEIVSGIQNLLSVVNNSKMVEGFKKFTFGDEIVSGKNLLNIQSDEQKIFNSHQLDGTIIDRQLSKNIDTEPRFNTKNINNISSNILTTKMEQQNQRDQMLGWNNNILERGQSNMVNSIKSLQDTTKESNNFSSYIENNSQSSSDQIPTDIENLGIFLTNTSWV